MVKVTEKPMYISDLNSTPVPLITYSKNNILNSYGQIHYLTLQNSKSNFYSKCDDIKKKQLILNSKTLQPEFVLMSPFFEKLPNYYERSY